jgi:hypothetical protein
MINMIADGRRVPIWTMVRANGELQVGLVPEFLLQYQAAERAELA